MNEQKTDSNEEQLSLEKWSQPLTARYAKRKQDDAEEEASDKTTDKTKQSQSSEESDSGKTQESGQDQERSQGMSNDKSEEKSDEKPDEKAKGKTKEKQKGKSPGGSRSGNSPISATNPFTFALNTGLFAGLIWGGVRIIEYYFRFTKVHPTFLIKPWTTPAFNQTTLGYMSGWGAFILFSVVAALLYVLVLRKVRGAWAGMLYGLVWWGVIYFLVGPRLGMMKPLGKIDWNSLITDGCLFLLWGAFIGYTIAFEFTDEQQREPGLSMG